MLFRDNKIALVKCVDVHMRQFDIAGNGLKILQGKRMKYRREDKEKVPGKGMKISLARE